MKFKATAALLLLTALRRSATISEPLSLLGVREYAL